MSGLATVPLEETEWGRKGHPCECHTAEKSQGRCVAIQTLRPF